MNSEELKEIRTKLALSKEEFAKKIGVSSMTVRRWEEGAPISENGENKIKAFATSQSAQFTAGRDIHHVTTQNEDAMNLLKKQQELTAEAMAQNAKLIDIIEKLTK